MWIIEWTSEFLSEEMSGRVSQWVSDEMREQSNEQADVCNYGSGWENEEVCELMTEDLNWYVSEYVNNLGGREVQRGRERERVSLMYGRRIWPLLQC